MKPRLGLDRFLLAICIVILAGHYRVAIAADFPPEDVARIGKLVNYYNPSRTALFFFQGYTAGYARVQSKQPGKDEANQIPEETVALIYSCSNDAYLCLKSRWDVYAIPRVFSLDIQNYVVGGASFTVLECVKQTESRCQVALIEADCQWLLNEFGECSPVADGRAASPRPGWVLAFIYNEDFGITAMGSIDVKDIGGDRLAVARRAAVFTLNGTDGLLKPKTTKRQRKAR